MNFVKKKNEINQINSMISHAILSEIALKYFIDEKYQKCCTRKLQFKIMDSIRYTKLGKKLFYDTGRYMDYSSMRGFNKPKIYGLVGTENENEKANFYGNFNI